MRTFRLIELTSMIIIIMIIMHPHRSCSRYLLLVRKMIVDPSSWSRWIALKMRKKICSMQVNDDRVYRSRELWAQVILEACLESGSENVARDFCNRHSAKLSLEIAARKADLISACSTTRIEFLFATLIIRQLDTVMLRNDAYRYEGNFCNREKAEMFYL